MLNVSFFANPRFTLPLIVKGVSSPCSAPVPSDQYLQFGLGYTALQRHRVAPIAAIPDRRRATAGGSWQGSGTSLVAAGMTVVAVGLFMLSAGRSPPAMGGSEGCSARPGMGTASPG